MKHYYFMDCKLNRYLRQKFGIEKPYALEWGGWDKWNAELKASKPLAYFLTETVPHFLDDVHYSITEIWNKPKRYIRNRFIDRLHVLPTGLEKGVWWDCDSRLEGALRQLIIDFVEIELAGMHDWKREMKWVNGRCPEAGLGYIGWAKELKYDENSGSSEGDKYYGKPTQQSIDSIEIAQIYDWCKNIRPNRPDAMDISGWSAHCDALRDEGVGFFSQPKTAEERKRGDKALKLLRKIEADYDREDTEMYIRIIKVRKALWT